MVQGREDTHHAATGPDVPPPVVHIRASAGTDLDARKVGRAALVVVGLLLVGVVVATTVGAVHQNTVQASLQRRGEPVEVTVTGCEGASSGIGQSIVYYICRGTYTLDGHRYNEVIGGTRAVHPTGRTLRAVAVPGDPARVSTAAAVARPFSRWTPFVTPIVLTAGGLVLACGLAVWRRRRSRAGAPAPRPGDVAA